MYAKKRKVFHMFINNPSEFLNQEKNVSVKGSDQDAKKKKLILIRAVEGRESSLLYSRDAFEWDSSKKKMQAFTLFCVKTIAKIKEKIY